MSKVLAKQTTDFRLEGRFLGFATGDGYKLKYIRLVTESGEHQIKLSKELRSLLYQTLTPGVLIEVLGYQKLDWKRGTLKRKAYQVTLTESPVVSFAHQPVLPAILPVAPCVPPVTPSAGLPPTPLACQKGKTNILVCQKCKRGERAVIAALESELDDRGLAGEVTIKPTGCMKQCKAGPNVVMPDKTRYSRVSPDDVPELLEKHLPIETPAIATSA